MKGLLIKTHSNFYYVKNTENNNIYECMLRERLKKEDHDIIVGDYVEVDEINDQNNQAVITNLYPRKTYITRPHIANMDQNIIIMALNQPPLDFTQLDRYITHTKLFGLELCLCINKCDLKDKKNVLPKLYEIYEPLGIKVIEVSAKNQTGLDKLLEYLKNRKSIFSGPSGVGKSTILNSLDPQLNLKTGLIGKKSNQGTHTTRHTELLFINSESNQNTIIADTPGFSYLKFNKCLPEKVETQFPEFKNLKQNCYYSDCLHINELNCSIKDNMDKIAESRYKSYCRFITEALEYKELLYSISSKDEGRTKTIDSSGENQVSKLKLGHNLVDTSRKSYNQRLNKIKTVNNEELEYDETLD